MNLIDTNLVMFDVPAKTKEEVIRTIAEAMDKDGRLLDVDGYIADVFAREEEFTTSIGFGVATPHAKSEHVAEPSLGYMRLREPMYWGEDQVDTIFQIAVPKESAEELHLKILANVSRHLIHEDFRERLSRAQDPNEVIAMLNE
jgi:fructose-specific phosphotransferase system IIA component